MPPLTIPDMPFAFGANHYRHYNGSHVYLLAAHLRNRPRVFYTRRLYTSPFVHNMHERERVHEYTVLGHNHGRVENVLLGFPETEHEFATGVGQTLSRLYSVECEPLWQRTDDVKYYAGLVHMPLVVWLDPVIERAQIGGEKEIYYYEDRSRGSRIAGPVSRLR